MTKPKPITTQKSYAPKSITHTHNGVQLTVTFRETPPDTNVKQNIITMLTSAYQDKILSQNPPNTLAEKHEQMYNDHTQQSSLKIT